MTGKARHFRTWLVLAFLMTFVFTSLFLSTLQSAEVKGLIYNDHRPFSSSSSFSRVWTPRDIKGHDNGVSLGRDCSQTL
jgi:hypothetical protein